MSWVSAITTREPAVFFLVGTVLLGLGYAWFRYAVPHMVRTRNLVRRHAPRKPPLDPESVGVQLSRWGGLLFLVVMGVIVIAEGVANIGHS
jgi:hypothetical protein